MNPSVDKTVKSGLRGNSSYESGMTPWMRFTVIGELELHNSGKEQVILRFPYLRKHCHHVLCHNYFDMVFLSRFFIFIDIQTSTSTFAVQIIYLYCHNCFDLNFLSLFFVFVEIVVHGSVRRRILQWMAQ